MTGGLIQVDVLKTQHETDAASDHTHTSIMMGGRSRTSSGLVHA